MTRKDKHGVWIMVCVAFFFVGMTVLYCCLRAAADGIDPETLCRTGKQDPVIKMLVDKTDPWDERTRKRLAAVIRRLKSSLALHERLSIFILDETGTYSPTPLFDMCNPGRGDQANALYQNPSRIQRKFDEQFAGPLDDLLATLLRPGTAPRSPIIETLHGLRGNNSHERLIIVSDMMQNSVDLSFYGSGQNVDYDQQKDICRQDTPYESVQVFFINRPKIGVSKKQQVRNYWEQCLSRASWEKDWRVL